MLLAVGLSLPLALFATCQLTYDDDSFGGSIVVPIPAHPPF